MIIFDLICDSKHQFEGWFENANDLHEQRQKGMLTCPVCDSQNVTKEFAAPKISKKSNSVSVKKPSLLNQPVVKSNTDSPEKYKQLQGMLRQVHDYVDQNFEDVGNQFSSEAISIHRGEKDPVNIRGTASKQQLKEMAEEGVTATPLPPKPIDKDKVN